MRLYSPMNNFVENLRKLFKNRVKDGRPAFLGDGTGRVEVPDRKGYVYYRFQIGDSPGIARSGDAPFPVYEGAEVYIAIGYNGEPEIVGANYQRLDEAGFDTRTFNQLHQQSKWVYLFQITIGLCTAVATSATSSYLVSIKKHLTYYANALTYFETGEEADKLDLEAYKPGSADQHRYVIIWKDAYGNVAEVTASTAQSLFMPLDISDVNEAVAGRPPDAQIYKAFVVTNPGNAQRQSITEIDLRQFLNVPQVHGFPSPVTYRERIHPDRQVLVTGSLVVTGSLEVLGSLVGIGTGDSGSGSGSSGMTDFNVAADTGTPAVIGDGDTLTLTGGSGIDTAVAGSTVTAAVDSTVIRTTGTQSIGAGLTVTTPTIASFTNAQHNHTNAAGGGQITDAALSSQVTVPKGGTNRTSLTDHSLLIGKGTAAVDFLAPSTARKVAISDGTDWTSRALVYADLPAFGTDESTLNEASDIVSNTTTFATISVTVLSLDVTISSGKVLVGFNGAVLGAVVMWMYFDLQLNGTRVGGDDGMAQILLGTTSNNFAMVRLLTGLSAGSHNIKLMWKMQLSNNGTLRAGAGTGSNDTHPQFWAQEVL